MILAHVPPYHSRDWLTLPAAVTQYGLPVALLEQAITEGDLACRVAAGERVIRRAEVQALRLRLMAGRCALCE